MHPNLYIVKQESRKMFLSKYSIKFPLAHIQAEVLGREIAQDVSHS